jgi:hypothetical protein
MATAKKQQQKLNKLNFITDPNKINRLYLALMNEECPPLELVGVAQKKLFDVFVYLVTSEAFSSKISNLLRGDDVAYSVYNAILPQDEVKWIKTHFLPKEVNLKLSSAECSRLKLLRFMLVQATAQHCNIDALNAEAKERFVKLMQLVSDGKLSQQAVNKAHDEAMASIMLAVNHENELGGSDFLIEAASFSNIKHQLGKTQHILAKSSLENRDMLRKFGDLTVIEQIKSHIANDDVTTVTKVLEALEANRDDIPLILLHKTLHKHSLPFGLYFLVMMFATKAYLRRFMFVSGYDLLEDLLKSPEANQMLNKKQLVEALKLKAGAALRIGKTEVAQQIFTQIVTTYPDDFDAHLSLGLLYMVEEPEKAGVHLRLSARARRGVPRPMKLTIAEIFRVEGMQFEYERLCFELMSGYGQHPETFCLTQNMYLQQGNMAMRDASLNTFFELQNLMQPYVGEKDPNHLFEIAPNGHFVTKDHPLVTIIMTTYNAEKTVRSAVQSVLSQTYQNVELYVIDDVSSDSTREILAQLQTEDSRLHVLLNNANMGTYASKNQGIEKAKGEYITFHDSDDWMHPQRIELNLKVMQNQSVALCSSNWIRMDQFGFAIAQKHGGFIYRNPASTFFRRDALSQLGYFDSVRTGADTEMYNRAGAILGAGPVVLLDACLAIGLHHSDSLTQSGAGAIDGHRYSPVRVEYWQAFGQWHIEAEQQNATSMFLPRLQKQRFFAAPDAIRVDL